MVAAYDYDQAHGKHNDRKKLGYVRLMGRENAYCGKGNED
jgi:hypothetical protein